MSDIGGGNSAFDFIFFGIEGTGAVVVLGFLMAVMEWRGRGDGLPRWPAVLFVVAAVVLGPGIAIYWQAAYPCANGIEGVGRFLFGGAATLANAVLAGLSAFTLLERRVRWVALAPAGMVIAFWGLFLL